MLACRPLEQFPGNLPFVRSPDLARPACNNSQGDSNSRTTFFPRQPASLGTSHPQVLIAVVVLDIERLAASNCVGLVMCPLRITPRSTKSSKSVEGCSQRGRRRRRQNPRAYSKFLSAVPIYGRTRQTYSKCARQILLGGVIFACRPPNPSIFQPVLAKLCQALAKLDQI